MNNLEKEIEKSAKSQLLRNFSIDSQDEFSAIKLKLTSVKDEMIEFAKSKEAKAFHTHALKIEMVAKCAKIQVELKKNLYIEEDMKDSFLAGRDYQRAENYEDRTGEDHNTPNFDKWFSNIKKK